nr:DUF3499 domain-containing protein [Gordonia otitidis]
MKLPRQCCRPACSRSAVATLTFVYAESTAVIGPLATSDEPHSWDLCEEHARRITVPRGWEMLRSERGFSAPVAEDYELTALAEAVREVGARGIAGAVGRAPGFDQDVFDDAQAGRHRAGTSNGRGAGTPNGRGAGAPGGRGAGAPGGRGAGASGGYGAGAPTGDGRSVSDAPRRSGAVKPRPGRRGHLRVLPDPVD